MSSDELNFGFHLPAGREAFRTWEVARILRHDTKQIVVLIEQGKFGHVVTCGTGEKKSYVVSRAALEKFIRENGV